jgi:hypothetical protein
MGRKKNNHRQVEFKYEFDRLGRQKIEQVYDILLAKVMMDVKKKREKLGLVYEGKSR